MIVSPRREIGNDEWRYIGTPRKRSGYTKMYPSPRVDLLPRRRNIGPDLRDVNMRSWNYSAVTMNDMDAPIFMPLPDMIPGSGMKKIWSPASSASFHYDIPSATVLFRPGDPPANYVHDMSGHCEPSPTMLRAAFAIQFILTPWRPHMAPGIHQHRTSPSPRHLLPALLVLLLVGTASLHAQRYQESYGSSNPLGDEANAVITASNTDHVTAGVTYTNGFPQICVVRTDQNGNILWAKTYTTNFFTYHGANDIKELPNGDFAVVGWGIETPGLSDTMGVVMKIDPNGVPIWVRSCWINLSNTMIRSAVVTQIGGGGAANPGDIVFAGYTLPYSPVDHDALLGRIDPNGNMVWCRSYNHQLAGQNPDEQLYGVDESTVLSSGGTLGDIVATGVLLDPGSSTAEDVLVMRVDGNTGDITNFPQGSAAIGGSDYDAGYAIQELRYGSNPGTLAITGTSKSRPFPSNALEAFALEIKDDPCNGGIIAATYLGDNGGNDDIGTCLREITPASPGNVGNIVVGGTTRFQVFGGAEGFMQEFQEGSMNPSSPYYVYGGGVDDEIRSIAEAPQSAGSPGYVYAGVTQSQSLIDPSNLRNIWMGKTNVTMDNFCDYAQSSISAAAALWTQACRKQANRDDVIVGSYQAIDVPLNWNAYQPCYSASKPVPQGNHPDNSPDAEGTGTVSLAGYPNPIRHQDHISLNYSTSSAGVVEIIVTDPLGRICYQRSSEHAAGDGAESVPVNGWAAGSYLARISANGVSATTRIVVLGE
ncbi:MAG: hypothetical protein JWQ98_909 [Chlorobi bacterium]|nr:hypothetical protein [Chlorobiota bacterium]